MPKPRPTTRAERQAKPLALATKFTPKFWERLDKRRAAHRLIRERIDELCDEVNADSMAKRMLVERAVFLSLQCQSIELDAYDGIALDPKRLAVHSNLSNSLMGILNKLGLEKESAKDLIDLDDYLEQKKAGKR